MASLLDIPRKFTIPAIVATASYLNAKFGIALDLWTLWHQIGIFGVYIGRKEKKDRMNIFYCLEDLALDPKFAGRTFLIVPRDEQTSGNHQTEWTYSEAYELVLKYAAWLKDNYKIQKNEIIAMDFTNRPEFIWVWFGLWSLGAIPAFINYNLQDQAFVHSVHISTARLLLVDHRLKDVLTQDTLAKLAKREDGGAVDTVVVEPEMQQHILAQTPYRAPDEVRSGAGIMTPAMLIYTSGTTGLPKAARVQWGKAWSGVRLFSTLCGIQEDDHYLTALPLYHSSGSVLGVLQVLNTGAAVVVCPRFSPRTFMKWAHETKATGVQYIGEMCRYLVASPPTQYDRAHNIRFAFGNGMRPDVWQEFKDRFNVGTIAEFYGATEGSGACYIHSRNAFLRGAVGKQGLIIRNLLNTFVIVQHDHSTDEPYRDPQSGLCVKCKTSEPGELLHPLDPNDIEAKYLGYFNNDKATMSKVLRNVLKKGDAYYRTGDLQKRDEEGRLWFVDRVGDTFRWKSENVSTAEVSQAIGSHPKVTEANVYGVQIPGFDGRAGCAAVVLTDGQTFDSNLSKELALHASKQLPQYAVPLFLRIMKRVEVTGTLKHQKVALRNEGVDPANFAEDEVYWLERGAERYNKLEQHDWKRIVNGNAKL